MFTRYAVYYTAPPGALADVGAAWLGWDVARGVPVAHPTIEDFDIATMTAAPRPYGLHGTIKPPFALAHGMTQKDLQNALRDLCADLDSVTVMGLDLETLGRFLALCPVGDTAALNALAARVVADLDGFRAPLSDHALAQRRTRPLTPAQDANLVRWGYPHIMDTFRFHITLTGRLDKQTLTKAKSTLASLIAPLIPAPFAVDGLTLVGRRSDGMFEQIVRYPLAP